MIETSIASVYGLIGYVNTYAVNYYGLSATAGSALGGTRYLLQGVGGIIGGILADKIHSRIKVLGWSAAGLAISFVLYIILPVNASLVAAVIINFVVGLILIYAVRSQYFAIHEDAGIPMEKSGRVSGIPQGSGRIINICSLFSFLGGLGSPAYAAMKAGLMGLTKAYADELGKYGITVNGIAPGYFQTAMTAGTGSGNEDDPKYIKIKEHIPADRWGERQDLMGAMVFLASKAAEYVNGTLLVVDGGYLVR